MVAAGAAAAAGDDEHDSDFDYADECSDDDDSDGSGEDEDSENEARRRYLNRSRYNSDRVDAPPQLPLGDQKAGAAAAAAAAAAGDGDGDAEWDSDFDVDLSPLPESEPLPLSSAAAVGPGAGAGSGSGFGGDDFDDSLLPAFDDYDYGSNKSHPTTVVIGAGANYSIAPPPPPSAPAGVAGAATPGTRKLKSLRLEAMRRYQESKTCALCTDPHIVRVLCELSLRVSFIISICVGLIVRMVCCVVLCFGFRMTVIGRTSETTQESAPTEIRCCYHQQQSQF